MTPCNSLKPASHDAVERTAAADGGTRAAEGFVTELAAQIEQKTGGRIDRQALANWLEEHSTDDPGIARDGLLSLLSQLLEQPIVMGSAVPVPSGELGKDAAALLGRLIATSGELGRSGAGGGAALARLLAALRAGGQVGEALAQDANAGSVAPAAFQGLLQSAASAGAPALAAANENRAGIVSLQLATPVGQAGFGQAVGDRLLWMVQNEVHHARLQLNPPGLGPLDISVSLQDERISIALNAHHAITREALAADAPRLRGLLADAGFSAVDVNVSQDQRRGDDRSSGTAPEQFIAREASGVPETSARVQGEGQIGRGRSLVDHYA